MSDTLTRFFGKNVGLRGPRTWTLFAFADRLHVKRLSRCVCVCVCVHLNLIITGFLSD